MHSATKYLNGHSDVIAGALATRKRRRVWQRIRYVRGGGGAVLGPFEAWLLLRGMRTLHLRVAAACANAHGDRAAFRSHPAAFARPLSGPAAHPNHAVAARQMRGGFGGMLSLRVRAGEQAAKDFTARAARIQARHFARLGREPGRASRERRRSGDALPADLVRLSIGIEHVDDLIEDIEQALA